MRQEKLRSADELVKLLLDRITTDLTQYNAQQNNVSIRRCLRVSLCVQLFVQTVVLLVNSLGATPPMEVSIIARSAVKQLGRQKRETSILCLLYVMVEFHRGKRIRSGASIQRPICHLA